MLISIRRFEGGTLVPNSQLETVCEYEYENLSSNGISIPDGTDGEFDLTWD